MTGDGAAPHAPWSVRGEVLVALARWRDGRAGRLPAGLRPLPGPAAVVAVRYTDSPVGPYVELSVAEPARLGLRPGLCVTNMVVSEPVAKVGNRLNWGLPAEVGRLDWSSDGDGCELVWYERGLVVSGRPVGPLLPAAMPVRSVQRRGDGPVLVPRRLAALLQIARAEVRVPDDDPLAGLAGRHPGALLRSVRMVVHPARQPSGALSSFRAPLQAPELARWADQAA